MTETAIEKRENFMRNGSLAMKEPLNDFFRVFLLLPDESTGFGQSGTCVHHVQDIIRIVGNSANAIYA